MHRSQASRTLAALALTTGLTLPGQAAHADNLGAIGQAGAFLLVLAVAAALLAVAVAAWILGRRSAPRARWRAWFAAVTLVAATGPAAVLAANALSRAWPLLAGPTVEDPIGEDAAVLGGALAAVVVFAALGQLRLFLRNWRRA